MPKEGDEMDRVKKRYIILAIIFLIECIAYGTIKYKNKHIEGPLKPTEIRLESINDIHDKSEKQLDFFLSLGMLISLAIGNSKIKSKKIKWMMFVLGIISIWIGVQLIISIYA
jgi:Ca2+/Na+ antiporter